MNAVKRLLVIVGVICLGLILVFLNRGLKNSAVPDKDEDEQAQQTQKAKEAAVKATPTDPKSVPAAEETVGDPATARHHIQVGWVYDEDNQKKPETLSVPLQTIRDYVQHSGAASAEVVDLDVPVEDRSPAAQAVTELGISVDGKRVSSDNLSSVPFPSDQIIGALTGPAPAPAKKPQGKA